MIVAFVGPSLYGVDAELLHGLELRPPAVCGDLWRAVKEGATVIGLIDGVFESVPSVWHKEILFGLDRGVTIYGSSSMGALRAAECHTFGMVGVGRIFMDYAAGRRTADADVAVTYAPAALGFQPLSLALVDAEFSLNQARENGLISSSVFDSLLLAARSMHFKERTWESVIDRAFAAAPPAPYPLEAILSTTQSRKRLDAIELLRRLQSYDCTPRSGPSFRFNCTQCFDRLRTAT